MPASLSFGMPLWPSSQFIPNTRLGWGVSGNDYASGNTHAPAIPSYRKPHPGWSGTSGGLRRLNQRYLMLRQPVEGRVVRAYWTHYCFFELGTDSGKIEDRQAGFISDAAPEFYCRHL